MKNTWIFLFILFFLTCFQARSQFYYGTQTEFGKNRIQYKDEFWSFLRFERFDTYFYQGGKPLAVFASKNVQKNLDDLEKFFDYGVEGKIEIIIYNKLEDFRQSNIGIADESQNNIGGTSRIAGNKVFLYFEGSYADLEKQIRGGLSQIIIYQMLYGGDWKDKVKNSTLLNLPEWYIKGLVSYMSNKWNVDVDNKIKDAVFSGKLRKFNRLSGEEAVMAGHSIWNYVAEVFGSAVISNIVYMTRISRNVDSGFLFVIGSSLKTMMASWMDYYEKKYEVDQNAPLPDPEIEIPSNKNTYYSNLKISPDENWVVYTTNQMGQYKVWLYELSTNKKKLLFKKGHKLDRINDLSYPLLDWHPTGKVFSMIHEKKGRLFLNIYDMEEKKFEEKEIFNLEKILSFSYSHDGKRLAVSAIQNGQSDIFVYTIASNSLEQITKDQYEDIDPVFIKNGAELLFSSDRIKDTLVSGEEISEKVQDHNDLFIFDYKSKSKVLKRITTTPDFNETAPDEFDSKYFTFLSDMNGINNRFLGYFDSSIAFIDTIAHYNYFTTSFPITDYSRNIIEHNFDLKSKKYSEIIFIDGKYKLFIRPIPAPAEALKPELNNSSFRNKIHTVRPNTGLDQDRDRSISQDTTSKDIDINNYQFNIERLNKKDNKFDPELREDTLVDKPDTLALKPFILPKPRNYNVKFSKDIIVNQIDNSQIIGAYQRFIPEAGPYINPGLSAVLKIGISDLFENYKVIGGIRFGNNNSREYFMSLDDLKYRWDKHYEIARQDFRDDRLNVFSKHVSYIFRYGLNYPFSEVASFRGSVSMRNDRVTPLASDLKTLTSPDTVENWGSIRAQYVFDNTLFKGINLYNGTRFKLFAEYYNQVENRKKHITILGMDFRNYLKVHKNLIWANRFAASTSFGTSKLLYYMGGVDNWVITKDGSKFLTGTPIDQTQNYRFQTLANNMRGFLQNSRNGNSFAVINSELRFPIFKYFIDKPLRSEFISNFQIIGFADVGTAWTGPNPYSNTNFINTEEINSPPLLIIIDTHKEPIIGGIGYGFRSKLFGYFIRLDYGYGIEDGKIADRDDRVFYLSLSTDF